MDGESDRCESFLVRLLEAAKQAEAALSIATDPEGDIRFGVARGRLQAAIMAAEDYLRTH